METKNQRIFIKEWNTTQIPYKHILSLKHLKLSLYNETLKTVPVPNLHLYDNKYFTDKEISTGLIEANNNLPSYESRNDNVIIAASFVPISDFEKRLNEIKLEFYEKVSVGQLHKKYYSHSIKETSTYKSLVEVDYLLIEFRSQVNNDPIGFKDYASVASSSIIKQLDKIKITGLKYAILEYLTDTKEQRTYAKICFSSDDRKIEKYQNLNGFFMQNLRIELAKCEPVELQEDNALNMDSDLDAVYKHYQKTGNFLPRRLFSEFKDYKGFLMWQDEVLKRYWHIYKNLPEKLKLELKSDFFDMLKELEASQTKSKFEEGIKKLIKETGKSHTNKLKQKKLFEQYRTAMNGYFKDTISYKDEDGYINQLYYQIKIDYWTANRQERIKQNPLYKTRIPLLKSFIVSMGYLMESTCEAFSKILTTKVSDHIPISFTTRKLDIKGHLNGINEYARVIRHNIIEGNPELALMLQEYFLLMFDEAKGIIEDFGIFIERTPLNDDFIRARKFLEDAIDKNKINYSERDKSNTQIPQKDKDENEEIAQYDPNYFNEDGFKLFKYLIDNYKKDGIIKYINIWYFLKRNNPNSEKFTFNHKQKTYKAFIKKEFGTEIKKFSKAEFLYVDEELPNLKRIAKNYTSN